jgi:hypothetical protein
VTRRTLPLVIAPGAALLAAGLIAARLHFEPPTVPVYAIAADAGEVVLRPGADFEMELHPTAPVLGAVGARGFLLRGEQVRPWDPPFVVGRDGSVRISGSVEKLFAGIPPGEWEVAVAVGRPETLPTAPRDVLRAREVDAGATAWRLVRERVVVP